MARFEQELFTKIKVVCFHKRYVAASDSVRDTFARRLFADEQTRMSLLPGWNPLSDRPDDSDELYQNWRARILQPRLDSFRLFYQCFQKVRLSVQLVNTLFADMSGSLA